jgi:hypothetical protein
MQVLKQTVRRTIDGIDLELTVPSHREAPRRLAIMGRFNKQGSKKDADGETDVAGFYEAMQEERFVKMVDETFAKYVRPLELQDEKGKAIETGEQLLDVAPHALVMGVLLEFQKLCLPDAETGKASSSPSTSSAAASGIGSSSSGATSTASEGGAGPSDATVPTAAGVSS